MTARQDEDGFAHFAYYRADKGLSFTWNGTKGNVLDVSYGGSGEPVFATLGLGFDPNTHALPQAFARMQQVADRAADTFVIGFWERAIDNANRWPVPPSWGERGPQTAAEYDAEVAPVAAARECPKSPTWRHHFVSSGCRWCEAPDPSRLPELPLALAGYHGADEDARVPAHPWEASCDVEPRCPEHWLGEEITCQRAPYDVLWCAQHRDDFPDGAAKCLSAAGLPQRGYRSGVTAAGFTDSFEWPNEEGRWQEGERHSEARIGASLLRHAAAHGHVVRDLDFLMAVYRDARRRFPRGGGEENTDIGRLGATIASYSSKPDWVA